MCGLKNLQLCLGDQHPTGASTCSGLDQNPEMKPSLFMKYIMPFSVPAQLIE